MWLAAIMQTMALAVTAPTATAATSTATPPGVVYTRQMLFAIPFHIDRPQSILQEPVEVQLYVSADQGTHWDYYTKVEPARQQFMFRVDRDGQYWFQARTLDRSGAVRPKTPTPGLKVVVDTTPPKIQLQSRRGDGGQVTVHWQIDEVNPKPDSLTVQFRTAPTAAWQPVALDRQILHATGNSHIGEVTFMPPADAKNIEIRADAVDLAGNPAVNRIPLHLVPSPLQQQTVTARPSGPANRLLAYGNAAGTAATGTPGGNAIAATAVPPATGTWRAGQPETPAIHWPAANTGAAPGPTGLAAQPPRVVTVANAGMTSTPPANPVPPTATTPVAPAPPSVTPVAPPSTTGAVPPTTTTAALPSGPILTGMPAGERPRMVRSRVIALEYDIDAIGPSGIGRVELWGTRDGGRTWRSFGVDEKKHSPMLVSVDREGLFGFRVVVSSGAAVGAHAPQSGDRPEVWIGVDLTPPAGRITSVAPGNGPDRDKLVITWEARDQMLMAARPITLSFAATPNGPWQPIAAGMENTGRFAWPSDNRFPLRGYLRLEMRDEAGNVGQYVTPEPVSLDRSRPVARIRSVRPMDTGMPQ
jgi:hypothetical protein